MTHNLPTSSACQRNEHAKCADADQTCGCPCHKSASDMRTLTHRSFSNSGAGPRTDAPTVDEIDRVARWLGVEPHVLVEMQRGQRGDLGAAYHVGYADGAAANYADASMGEVSVHLEWLNKRIRKLLEER